MDDPATTGMTRYARLKSEFEHLLEPAAYEVAGLGRSARVTVTAESGDAFVATYSGVSERGVQVDMPIIKVALADPSRLPPGKNLACVGDDGRVWRFWSGPPEFSDPEEETPEIGPSEQARMVEFVRSAVQRFVNERPEAILAKGLLKQALAAAHSDRAVEMAEKALQDARRRAEAMASRAEEMEAELGRALDGKATMAP